MTFHEFVPYFLAILGLLAVWAFHEIQVRAGRIQAVDFWDRSGIRFFIHATPNDGHICPACLEANGKAFLPYVATVKKFTALQGPCTNPSGCRCLLVGLYGGWPEARRLLDQLKLKSSSKTVQLSEKELDTLLGGQWAQGVSGTVDRMSVHMLEAMRNEGSNPEIALQRYRFVAENGKSDRDLPFVVPAYLRLADMLEQAGHQAEALEVVDRFLKAYGDNNRKDPHVPTDQQLTLMSLRKTRLMTAKEKSAVQRTA
ncbi:MAG TPA: hypothetical protein VFL31_06915 [Nitrospiraceae bacterium]|nr:hypothetical protein [Nitrospiraceae bacterium]